MLKELRLPFVSTLELPLAFRTSPRLAGTPMSENRCQPPYIGKECHHPTYCASFLFVKFFPLPFSYTGPVGQPKMSTDTVASACLYRGGPRLAEKAIRDRAGHVSHPSLMMEAQQERSVPLEHIRIYQNYFILYRKICFHRICTRGCAIYI